MAFGTAVPRSHDAFAQELGAAVWLQVGKADHPVGVEGVASRFPSGLNVTVSIG